MPRTLVVIPTYNEVENIEAVLGKAREAVPDASVLVVDDGSPDGTGNVVQTICESDDHVHLLRRPGKSGLGAAYRSGFAWGIDRGFEVMVEMDGDLSHDPADLPRLLEPLDAPVGLVIGSRYVPGGSTPRWSARRRWLSRWANRYTGAVLGTGVKDTTAGFRAYAVPTLEAIDFATTFAEGYAFQVEMTYRVRQRGHGIREVPIEFNDRVRGASKMSMRIVVEAMLLVTWWGIRDRLLRRGTSGVDAS